jgi:hypothetical protein
MKKNTIREILGVEYLVLPNSNLTETSNFINRHKISGIEYNTAITKVPFLDCLKQLDHIRHIRFVGYHVTSEEFDEMFKCFPNLESLSGIKLTKDMALDRLSSLRRLYCEMNKSVFDKVSKLEQLEGIGWVGFKPTNLLPLSRMKNLKDLRINGIKDLEGLNMLRSVRTLRISQTRHLKSLTPITELYKLEELTLYTVVVKNGDEFKQNILNLKRLEMEKVRLDNEWNILKCLPRIEEIIIDNCNEIKTLEHLNASKYLEVITIRGSTNILDGKINWLSERGVEVRVKNRTHYDLNR